MNQTFGYAGSGRPTRLHFRQNTDTQLDTLQKYGCDRIFQEKISGLSVQRPAWTKYSRYCGKAIPWWSPVSTG